MPDFAYIVMIKCFLRAYNEGVNTRAKFRHHNNSKLELRIQIPEYHKTHK